MTPAPDNDAAPQQLLAYAFPPGADFGGLLVGALQRIESGGAMRILEALFVGREADSGELVAVTFKSESSAGMIGALIDFRLDASARAKQTESALEGPAGELIRALAAVLEPGHAVAGVLVEHAWAQVLADAVARVGGAPLASEFIKAGEAEQAWARLAELIARPDPAG